MNNQHTVVKEYSDELFREQNKEKNIFISKFALVYFNIKWDI